MESPPEHGSVEDLRPSAEQTALTSSLTALLQSDLSLVAADYELLRALNEEAARRYGDMATVTKSLSVHVEDVKGKYRSFEPFLAKVDDICDSVAKLEQTVLMLDDYTMRLVRLACEFPIFILIFSSSM